MAVSSQVETKRSRYLLGLCSPAERERIESEYFEDENAFQEMLTAEDDLIDAYARGELTSEERGRFEKYFLTSQRTRDRVQFARAFTVVQVVSPLETRPFALLFGVFSWFRERSGALQIATVTAAIVLAVMVLWLLIQPGKMPNLHELHTGNAGQNKQAGDVLKIEDDKPTPTQGTTAHPDKPLSRSERSRSPKINERPQVAIDVPDHPEKSDQRETRESVPVEAHQQIANQEVTPGVEQLVNVSDATVGTNFVNKQITQLPLEARDVPNLLSLQPGVTRDGYVSGARADQSNVTLDGFDITPRFYYLSPRTYYSSNITTLTVQDFLESIRLGLGRESAARFTQYYAAVETGDGRPVTWLTWVEPVSETNSDLNTPEIPTADLPAGDYVLRLTAKEPDGSVVKVAEYWFRIVRN